MTAASPPLINFSDAAIRLRDRRVLRSLTWTIRPGENWAVVGPNGAGKSSLARALAGDLPVVAGRVRRHLPIPEVAGVSFESGRRLLARESRRAEADHFAGRIDGGTRVAEELGAAPAPSVGLGFSGLEGRAIDHLSTGELRKLLILRALARNPRLLVLDEPFDGLDADARRALARFLSDRMAAGVQLVLVTHRSEELLPGISHILCLEEGAVVGAGPMADFPRETVPSLSARRTDPINGRPLPSTPEPAAPPPPVLIEMTDVAVRHGDTPVFSGLSWRVERGVHWAVSGPNGAGKTTLLRMIAGDHPQAYANRIRLFGRRRGAGETIWDIRRRVGRVSGDLQLRYRRPVTALEAVLSGFFDSVGLFRRATEAQRAAAMEWLRLLDMGGHADRPFDHLSGGEQRMVLLARAAVKRPWLLILDEPCQGLDPNHRARVLALADRIGRDGATTLLWVAHHPAETPARVRRRLRFQPADAGGCTAVTEEI
jgi:molybdate transport system ATP-binding protein